MANIQSYLNQIKNAVFGKDVRESIHDAIKQCYDDAAVNHDNANMEVKLARGTHDTLNDRLVENEKNQEKISSQLDNIAKNKINWVNVVEYGIDNSGIEDVTTELQKLIDDNQGKVIYLPSGTYLISQIKLPLATTLQGDGLMSTIIKGIAETDMIVLKDYLSAHVCIRDVFIDGDYKATRGVWAFKEKYSLQHLDNSFVMENVYVKRCIIANIHLGKVNTSSIMECKLINIKSEQSRGIGLLLEDKCTDSYFEGIYCASNTGNGICSSGYNLKFVNCKVCWNGTVENGKAGVYISKGSLHSFINFEAQDNYGHGLFAQNTVNLNVQGLFDRNGNGGFDTNGNQIAPEIATKYGVYLKGTNFVLLNIVTTNEMYMATKKYTQKAPLGFASCQNINGDIVASHHTHYIVSEDTLSYNVDVNVNGHKWINILPTISLTDTEQDGVTFKQINDNSFIVTGTATSKTKVDLLGVYGNTKALLTIPAKSILKVKNANTETYVNLLVVGNKTNVLANVTKEQYVLIEENTDLSEIALLIDSGKTVNTIVSPTLEIIPIGNP